VSAARPAPLRADRDPRARFVGYVDVPRDRDILLAWARRLSPSLADDIDRAAVILGGRRPERARSHFQALRDDATAARGVCVLDRDDGLDAPEPALDPMGLEFFTWSRRHIESYLLVRDAMRRALRAAGDHPRVTRVLDTHVPDAEDEARLRAIDAKRLLASRGPLARALGRPLPPGRVAREMFVGELHDDIRQLFQRVREALRALEDSRLTAERRLD